MKTLFCTIALICFALTALPAAEPIVLFNGKNLQGWEPVLSDEKADPADTWSVKEGVLYCTGRPSGYLRTKRDDFENYHLRVEWRWPQGTPDNANNGVLVHASTPGALGVWPKSMEIQLANGEAGDFWVIPGKTAKNATTIKVPLEGLARYDDVVQGRRHLNFTPGESGPEGPLGQWNTMDIICRDDTITVIVNGILVNYGYDCSIERGAICLQSEGQPIAYRKVVLTPLTEEEE